MISFGGIGDALGGVAKKTGHDIESAGEHAEHRLHEAGQKIKEGLESALVIPHEAEKAAHEVDRAAETIAHDADGGFQDAVEAGKEAFDKVKAAIEKALHEVEEEILKGLAASRLDGLEPVLKDLQSIWPKLRSDLSSEFETIKKSAATREVTADAKTALHTIAKAPQFASFLAKHLDHSYASFGFEFSANLAAGVGGNAAVGVLAGLPDVADVEGFGSVGVSIGASVGGDADEALLIYAGSPSDATGPSVSVIFSLEVDVGGTVAVSFDLPHFHFLGFTIGLGEGEEANVALGAGYTFKF